MPRKPIPASEPLPSELQERLDVFKKYTAEHAMLSRKDDAVTQAVWEPGGFAFLLLSGPTGVGKSELLRGVTHRMQARAQVLIPGDRLPLPVVLVETPAPFTYREWYERVLLALDEPIIEELIYREVGTSPNGKKSTSGRASAKPLVRHQNCVGRLRSLLPNGKCRRFSSTKHTISWPMERRKISSGAGIGSNR